MNRFCYVPLAIMTLVISVNFGQAAVISVDFVYSGLPGLSAPVSDDTTIIAGPAQNAVGQQFAGQIGPWNALDIGGNNASVGSASTGLLLDGGGSSTSVRFLMGTAANALSGGWRNNYIPGLAAGGGTALRSETAYLYDGILTGPTYNWALTGLAPSTEYRLTLFGQGGGISNVANSVAAVLDSENDWDWTSVTSDSSGRIDGLFTGYRTPGIYGLQLEEISAGSGVIPEPSTFVIWALGLLGLGRYGRRRSRAA